MRTFQTHNWIMSRLEHANYNQCGLYGNPLHTNNNGISVFDKLEIKQENI